MADVLWIGGGCGAGKSTLARSLAYRYDLRLYPVDAYSFAHQARAVAEPGWPVQRAAAGWSFARRWVEPDVAGQVRRFLDQAVERFAMVCGELDRLPDSPPTVVEGPQLLPELVAARCAGPGRSLWLLPADGFAERSRRARGFGGPAEESVLAGVLDTLVARDRRLAAHLRAGVSAAGLAALEVDGTRSEAATLAAAVEHFAPVLDAAPRVGGAVRRRLRRAENEAVAANLAAYGSWLGVGAEAPRGPFVCECRTPGCAAWRTLAVAEYRALTAGGHLAVCG